MDKVDEYILQRFPNKEGKYETDKPYQCRQEWFNNDFPTNKELAEICNSTEGTIKNYRRDFNWKSIRQKAQDLQAELDREEFKKQQEAALGNMDEGNDIRYKELLSQLLELQEKYKDPSLDEEQKRMIRQEIRLIIRDMTPVQKDKLRTVKLPEKINDKQDHKHSGGIELNHRMKKFLDPKNITG